MGSDRKLDKFPHVVLNVMDKEIKQENNMNEYLLVYDLVGAYWNYFVQN